MKKNDTPPTYQPEKRGPIVDELIVSHSFKNKITIYNSVQGPTYLGNPIIMYTRGKVIKTVAIL